MISIFSLYFCRQLFVVFQVKSLVLINQKRTIHLYLFYNQMIKTLVNHSNFYLAIAATVFLIISLAQANVTPLDPSTIELIFGRKHPAVFLLTSSYSPSQGDKKQSANNKDKAKAQSDRNEQNVLYQFHKAADQYYTKYPFDSHDTNRLIFVVSDPNDGLYTYQRLAQFLGVAEEDTPTIIYLQEHSWNTKYKYNINKESSGNSMFQFIDQVQRGYAEVYYKSQSVKETQKSKDKLVQTVVAKNFEQIVLGSQKQYFVLFYAPFDYKSRVLKVQFQKAAESIRKNKNIKFVKVNSEKNQISKPYLNSKIGKSQIINEKNLPMIKFWKKDKHLKPIQYVKFKTFEKSYDFMVDWLQKNTQYEWINAEQVSQYVNQQL